MFPSGITWLVSEIWPAFEYLGFQNATLSTQSLSRHASHIRAEQQYML
jgi:hypothetical protein